MISRQDSPYIWDASLSRYRDTQTGRIVSVETIRDWSNTSIESTQGIVTEAANIANDNPNAWYNIMRNEIKGEYIRQYLAGAGGRNNMTQSDWGSVGAMIADQYRFLNDFFEEVQTGELAVESIAARSRMYINSAREAFARASQKSHRKAGYSQQKWTLGTTKQHCDNCPDFAGLGWVSIDFKYKVGRKTAYPGNGATQCLTNCDCHLEFRK